MRYFFNLYFRLFRWNFIGDLPQDHKKYIIVVAPHTSNYDFILGIMVRSVIHIKHAKYLAKSQLFKAPFGFLFRLLGGYPVDRSRYNNLVEAVVALFNSKDDFVIGLAPEGTRSKVEKLKTGFYHIAKGANVPIVTMGFDYGSKSIRIQPAFYPKDIKEDFKMMIEFYSKCIGANPKNGVTMQVYENMKADLEQQIA